MFRGYGAPDVRVRVAALRVRSWGRAPMRLLNWGRNMPSTKLYNLVPNDDYDTRIPLHPDEAFQYGITFNAKYIGTLDVPRPTSRVEIVAAMRRVRYEFKARGVKKRKVTVDVSTDGVRVTTRKTKSKKSSSVNLFGRSIKNVVSDGVEIMHHPIYRIFYVSHDSSDLKIFSYIARDGATNVFKCNVFKSNRKSQAMRIVRTVGQAFEVCHKMQSNPDQPAASTASATDQEHDSDVAPALKDVASDCGASVSGAASTTKVMVEPDLAGQEAVLAGPDPVRPNLLELLPPPPRNDSKRSTRTPPAPSITLPELPECITKVEVADDEVETDTPLSAQHQLQLLRERLAQQTHQTRAAVAQLLLLRDQLAAEQAARCEAQARTHQLLVHNKELLEHIAALVAHLQQRERGSSRPISAHHLTMLPQRNAGGGETKKSESSALLNGKRDARTSDPLINLITQTNKVAQNIENNNVIQLTPSNVCPKVAGSPINGPKTAPAFGEMNNDQIQAFLVSTFDNMSDCDQETHEHKNEYIASMFSKNQQFFQNCNAFPGIPLLTNHYSNTDLSSVMDHQVYKDRDRMTEECAALELPINKGQSMTSLCSQASTSKESSSEAISSDEVVSFIMPLSHNGTLRAKGEDGRVRLIVPVSPSASTAKVPDTDTKSEMTLKVPLLDRLDPAGPITRTTSEKVPNRSEMMTALRSQWARHTTK